MNANSPLPEGLMEGQLKDYRIIELLGQGGMGCVYLAEDLRLSRQVAIKILNQSDNEADQGLAEARLLARLNHPNIVHLYDVLSHQGQTALIMEYVQGCTLLQYHREHHASLEQKLQWLCQISEGLAAAHEQGIIHCDLKLANVLVNHHQQLKIADFGIARLNGGTAIQDKSYGTRATMSPEQLQNKAVDHRSDLFSLGLLAFELLSGEHPFGRGTSAQLAKRIVNEAAMDARHITPTLPPELTLLLNDLLAKDPAKRSNSARIVANRFKQVLMAMSQQSVLDEDTALLGDMDLSSEKSTRPKWPWLAAGLLAIVVGLSGWWALTPADVPTRYVAVMPPTFVADTNMADMQKDLVRATVDDALRQSVINHPNMRLIARSEVAAIEGGVKVVGKATGATDVISTELDCNNTRCDISFSRLGGEGWAVQQRQKWPVVLESHVGIYSSAQSHFTALYPALSHPGHAGYDINEKDYLDYIRLDGQSGSDEVLAQLKQVLTRSPNLMAAYRTYRDATREMYDLTKDITYIERWRELMQGAPPEYRYSTFQATDAFWLGIAVNDLAEAEKQLNIARQRGMSDADLMEMKAFWLRSNNQLAESVTAYQQALQLRPSTLLLHNLAISQVWMSEMDNAKTTLLQLLEITPKNYDANQLLATIYLLEGDIAQSISAYEQLLLSSEPQSMDLSNLGLAYALSGEYQKSLELAARAVQMSPQNPTWLLNLADAQKIAGQTVQADTNYRQVIALHQDKDDLKSWLERGQALVHLGRHGEAVKAINQAKKQAPDNGEVAFAAALIYTQLGEDISAITQVEEALNRDIGAVWFNLPWFDGLCERPLFVQLMAGQGSPLRCSG